VDLSDDWCEVDEKGLPVSVGNVRAKVLIPGVACMHTPPFPIKNHDT
jgi:hypothetical protein